jgi:hypothetical protein
MKGCMGSVLCKRQVFLTVGGAEFKGSLRFQPEQCERALGEVFDLFWSEGRLEAEALSGGEQQHCHCQALAGRNAL